MTHARFAARKDGNHTEIVEALRQVGASVLSIDAKDAPDLLVGYRGTDRLLEVKRPEILAPGLRRTVKIQSAGKLKPGQVAWHAAWRGKPVAVVHTVAEALEAIGFGLPPGEPTIDLEVAELLASVASESDCGEAWREERAQRAQMLLRKARAA